jgi:activating signal cointegrator 1
MNIKAISLYEPYASLIRTGAKKIETRSWETSYRGPLLICAAKKHLIYEIIADLSTWEIQGALAPLIGQPLDLTSNTSWPGIKAEHLSFGKAVALVDLVDCKRTGDMTLEEIGTDNKFGNFALGRFGWKLENIKSIPAPFLVTGHQKIFNVQLSSADLEQIAKL